jgi:hypothetical protein
VVRVDIQLMACIGCKEPKHGLIYVSNLVSNLNAYVSAEVEKKCRAFDIK